MHAVHIVDEELDDHGVVVGWAGCAGREQRDGAGAADREGGAGGPELGEVLGGPVRLHSRGFLVEGDEARDVAGDDADRDEVHGDLLGLWSCLHRTLGGIQDRNGPVFTLNLYMARPTTHVLTLLELLQSGGIRTVAELADRLGVDGRTVRRYVDHLIDLDVPVESVRGRYRGVPRPPRRPPPPPFRRQSPTSAPCPPPARPPPARGHGRA